MTDKEARAAVAAIVPPAALDKIAAFVDLVRAESARQNLVAKATLDSIWLRHVLDSAQLLPLAADAIDGPWLDVGTGAGFPGVIVALASGRDTVLVEPRRMRAAFLEHALAMLGAADRAQVVQAKIERVSEPTAAVISARAVAPTIELLNATQHLATSDTLYLLPKGQSATTESVIAQRTFSGLFHVEQSVTDENSGILVARNVKAKR